MVSQSDLQLFLEAVDALGTRPASFSSLDDLLENFGLTYEKAPFHDGFIRASVWNLSKESQWSDDYKGFLLQVKPEVSTRCLVGALANPECVDAAAGVLVSYGQKAVRFIHPPIPGTRLYKQITRVISMINAKAA